MRGHLLFIAVVAISFFQTNAQQNQNELNSLDHLFSSDTPLEDVVDTDTRLKELLKEDGIKPIQVKLDQSSDIYKLGSALFSDVRLSGNKNTSCMTCHHAFNGSSDSLPVSVGEGGLGEGYSRTLSGAHIIPRHSPQVFNMKYLDPKELFWDGRVSYNKEKHSYQTPEEGLNGENPKLKYITDVLNSTLAAQALFPLTSREEMLGKKNSNEIAANTSSEDIWNAITQRVLQVERYKVLFKKAFPKLTDLNQVNIGHIANALAYFQENFFVKLNSPFDKYVAGDSKAMTETEKRGAILFYSKSRCFICHKGLLQTDGGFKNVGFPQIGPGKDENRNDYGQFLVTNNPSDKYRFKTPSLRNLADTAPYGHSGSMPTIESVVNHYTHPMRANHHYEETEEGLPYVLKLQTQHMNERVRNVDPNITPRGIFISPDDRKDLIQFLKTGLRSI